MLVSQPKSNRAVNWWCVCVFAYENVYARVFSLRILSQHFRSYIYMYILTAARV